MSAPRPDARLARLLEEGKRFAILTHLAPDGDGLGSAMALCGFLRGRGAEARMINPDPVPDNYRFLALAGELEPVTEESAAFVESADAIFVLDNGSLERLGSLEPHVRRARGVKVCIDHHETRDEGWDLEILDSTAAASGEIVFEILESFSGELTPEIAESLYVAIITDTGHFRFSKTRPRSHRMTARLLESGVRPAEVYEKIYERKSEGALRLLGRAMDSMSLAADGRLVWTCLEATVLRELDAEQEDTGGIVNMLLSMAGTQLALLFRELPDGRVRVSLRSKGSVDVSRLAQRHGGGGHRNAAGTVLPGPLSEASRRLVQEAEKHLAAAGT